MYGPCSPGALHRLCTTRHNEHQMKSHGSLRRNGIPTGGAQRWSGGTRSCSSIAAPVNSRSLAKIPLNPSTSSTYAPPLTCHTIHPQSFILDIGSAKTATSLFCVKPSVFCWLERKIPETTQNKRSRNMGGGVGAHRPQRQEPITAKMKGRANAQPSIFNRFY